MDITVNSATVTLPVHLISGDRVVFRHPDGTADAIFFVSYARSEGRGGVADKLTIKVTKGKVDSEGLPLPKNLIGELSIYIPDGYDGTDADTVTAVMEGLIPSLTQYASTLAIPYS